MLTRLGISRHVAGIRALVLLVGLGVGTCVAGVCGCVGDPDTLVISTVTGEPLNMADIDAILNNSNLDEQEKRDRLLELGVPEDLVEVLLAS